MINKNKVLLFFLLLISFVIAYSFYFLMSDIENEKSVEIKSNKIEYTARNTESILSVYFSDKQSESNHYANTKFVKDILLQNLSSSKISAIREAAKYSTIKMKELENYMIFNRDMTLEDLKNSEGFRSIVISSIGQNGYSGIISDDAISIFHPNRNLEGIPMDKIVYVSNFTELLENISINNEKRLVEYELLISGVQNKVAYIEESRIQTSDGERLFLFTSTSIDDYKIPKILPKNNDLILDRILKEHVDYQKIIIVSNDGYVLYGDEDLVGLNLFYEDNKIGDFLMGDYGAKVLGPIYNIEEELVFVLSNPIYDNNEFLGYLVLQIKSDYVYDLINKNNFGNTLFLINEESLLASPYNNLSILSQEIFREDSKKCLSEMNGIESYNKTIFEYENIYGNNILSYYSYVRNPNLCILVETDRDFNDVNFEKIKRLKIIFSIPLLLGAVFIVYWIIFKSKIEIFKNYKRKRIYGFVRKINRIGNYNFIMSSLILLFLVFFAVNFFFFEFTLKNFATQIFNLGVLFSIIVVMKFGFKYKNNKLFVNSIIVAFISEIGIFVLHVAELYIGKDISPTLWAIPISIMCFNFPTLLLGIRRLKK